MIAPLRFLTISDDPEKFSNWTARIREAQLWLQQLPGLSLSLVAGVMLGSQIGEVADPEAAAVKTRLRSQAASETKCDSAATRLPHRSVSCLLVAPCWTPDR
jgi:hypothetical protein